MFLLKNKSLLEVISQHVFSPKAAGPETPSTVLKLFWRSKHRFEIILWWGELSKIPQNMQIIDLTISRAQIMRIRVPKSCARFFRTFPSCQNPLNCYMGQNILFGPYFRFFQFPLLLDPYWIPQGSVCFYEQLKKICLFLELWVGRNLRSSNIKWQLLIFIFKCHLMDIDKCHLTKHLLMNLEKSSFP